MSETQPLRCYGGAHTSFLCTVFGSAESTLLVPRIVSPCGWTDSLSALEQVLNLDVVNEIFFPHR